MVAAVVIGLIAAYAPCWLPDNFYWYTTLDQETWKQALVAAPKNGVLMRPYRGPLWLHARVAESAKAKKKNPMFILPDQACRLLEQPDPERKDFWARHAVSYRFQEENCVLPRTMEWHDDVEWNGQERGPPPPAPVCKKLKNGFTAADSLKITRFLKTKKCEEVTPDEICPFWRAICGSKTPPELPDRYSNHRLPYRHSWVRAVDPETGNTTWVVAPHGGILCRSHSPHDAYAHIADSSPPKYFTGEQIIGWKFDGTDDETPEDLEYFERAGE